jgi:hypothetical protein
MSVLGSFSIRIIRGLRVVRQSASCFSRQIDPTGKSRIPIYGSDVKPQNKKYFALSE